MARLYIIISTLLIVTSLQARDTFTFNTTPFAMEEEVKQTEILYAGNRLIVKNLEQDSVLEIYSIVGVKVYSIEIRAGSNEYPIQLPKGYYIVRIGKHSKKIAVR